jgi:hypothetical protein
MRNVNGTKRPGTARGDVSGVRRPGSFVTVVLRLLVASMLVAGSACNGGASGAPTDAEAHPDAPSAGTRGDAAPLSQRLVIADRTSRREVAPEFSRVVLPRELVVEGQTSEASRALDAWALFDRSTEHGLVAASHEVRVRVRLGAARRIEHLAVFGAANGTSSFGIRTVEISEMY